MHAGAKTRNQRQKDIATNSPNNDVQRKRSSHRRVVRQSDPIVRRSRIKPDGHVRQQQHDGDCGEGPTGARGGASRQHRRTHRVQTALRRPARQKRVSFATLLRLRPLRRCAIASGGLIVAVGERQRVHFGPPLAQRRHLLALRQSGKGICAQEVVL